MTNVLFVTADQWRSDCLGVAGHPVVRTPHVDAIAGDGARFARHYAGTAPCSPARACLYTGLYQMTNRVVRNGTPLDARHLTLAQAARSLGYDPTLFGYTDTGTDPRTTSPADPWLTTYEGILPGMSVRVRLPEYPGPWLTWLAKRGHDIPAAWEDILLPADGKPALHGKSPRFSAEETETAFLVEEFERWLAEQSGPWFAHLSFLSPHPPFVVPEPYASLYRPQDGEDFRRPANRREEAEKHPYLDFVFGQMGYGPDEGSEAAARAVRATYWGMVSEVDAQIGRVRVILEAAGQWDDTILVLTSDHAEQLGDHYLWGKLGFYDESYRIPLIIRDPRIDPATRGRVIDAPTEAVDIMPTLIDLLGGPVPTHVDGRSLAGFLNGRDPVDGRGAWRSEAHFEYDFRDLRGRKAQSALGLDLDACSLAAIRGERYKYVHFAGLPALLFDLAEDPHEMNDVSRDPAYAPARLEMAERLLSWRAQHLDRRLTGLDLGANGVFDGRAR